MDIIIHSKILRHTGPHITGHLVSRKCPEEMLLLVVSALRDMHVLSVPEVGRGNSILK